MSWPPSSDAGDTSADDCSHNWLTPARQQRCVDVPFVVGLSRRHRPVGQLALVHHQAKRRMLCGACCRRGGDGDMRRSGRGHGDAQRRIVRGCPAKRIRIGLRRMPAGSKSRCDVHAKGGACRGQAAEGEVGARHSRAERHRCGTVCSGDDGLRRRRECKGDRIAPAGFANAKGRDLWHARPGSGPVELGDPDRGIVNHGANLERNAARFDARDRMG